MGRLRVVCLLVMASVAVAAWMPTAASAAVFTEEAEWFVEEGEVKALAKQTPLDAVIAEHNAELGKKFTLSTVLRETPLMMTASAVECSGCIAENKEVTHLAPETAYGSGRIKLTEIKVDSPAKCSVLSEKEVAAQIITKPLYIHADWMEKGPAYWNFFPQVGANLATFELEGAGCPIAGLYAISGNLFGEMRAKTGPVIDPQNIVFGPLVQTVTGAGPLKIGTKEVKLTGTAAFSVTKAAGVKANFGVT